ncbi:hypothetical protein, partial [Pantoea ananatis]|uniref:hypothetical protein n=1 Tax=Pantoea ananas TaxID=553 RepID=UPI001C3FF796
GPGSKPGLRAIVCGLSYEKIMPTLQKPQNSPPVTQSLTRFCTGQTVCTVLVLCVGAVCCGGAEVVCIRREKQEGQEVRTVNKVIKL